MSIESDVFGRYRPDVARCEVYGFQRAGDVWRYERTFLDGAFRAVLTIDAAGHVTGEVIDTMTEEPYLPLRLANPAGSYVYGVRHAYEELLHEAAEACFTCLPFALAQTNRLCKRIKEMWGDAPEFPWESRANAQNGVFRHPVTRKWYAAVIPIAWAKSCPWQGREHRTARYKSERCRCLRRGA